MPMWECGEKLHIILRKTDNPVSGCHNNVVLVVLLYRIMMATLRTSQVGTAV